jgi:pimeloyl-ACP methyl ester carboxylesterase
MRADNRRTRVLEAGDPCAPTVLLVHDGAFGTDALLCWEGVISELENEYHLVAPDLLGWGGSEKVCYFDRSPYDFRLEHLASVCRTLTLDEPVFVIGSSFGAELAVRGTAEPKWAWSVRATVAISGTGGRLFRVPGGIERLSDYTPSLEAAQELTSYFVTSTEGMDDHVRRRYENSLTPGHWESLAALRVRNPTHHPDPPPDAWPEPLRSCEVPILFIEGEDDPLLESGWAQQMSSIAPRGSSEVVPGSHEPNLDQPRLIAELCRTFFAET